MIYQSIYDLILSLFGNTDSIRGFFSYFLCEIIASFFTCFVACFPIIVILITLKLFCNRRSS